MLFIIENAVGREIQGLAVLLVAKITKRQTRMPILPEGI